MSKPFEVSPFRNEIPHIMECKDDERLITNIFNPKYCCINANYYDETNYFNLSGMCVACHIQYCKCISIADAMEK